MTISQLESLPIEIFDGIMQYVEGTDITSVYRTSRRLRVQTSGRMARDGTTLAVTKRSLERWKAHHTPPFAIVPLGWVRMTVQVPMREEVPLMWFQRSVFGLKVASSTMARAVSTTTSTLALGIPHPQVWAGPPPTPLLILPPTLTSLSLEMTGGGRSGGLYESIVNSLPDQCPRLKSLDIEWVSSGTVSLRLNEILEHLRQLEVLSIRCQGDDLDLGECLGKGSSVKYLRLRWFYLYPIEGILKIIGGLGAHFPHLESLTIEGCVGMTSGRILECLAERPLRHLLSLDLSENRKGWIRGDGRDEYQVSTGLLAVIAMAPQMALRVLALGTTVRWDDEADLPLLHRAFSQTLQELHLSHIRRLTFPDAPWPCLTRLSLDKVEHLVLQGKHPSEIFPKVTRLTLCAFKAPVEGTGLLPSLRVLQVMYETHLSKAIPFLREGMDIVGQYIWNIKMACEILEIGDRYGVRCIRMERISDELRVKVRNHVEEIGSGRVGRVELL